MIKLGWITEAVWDKKIYRVAFRDRLDAYPVRMLETGAQTPLNLDDQVLCYHTNETDWIILGRIPTADKTTLIDDEKSEEQRLLEQHRKLIGDYVSGETDSGVGDSGIPNFGSVGEEAIGYGDSQIISRDKGSFVRADSSGSILAVVSKILCLVLDTFKTGILIRGKQLLLDIIPGFRLKIHSPEQEGSPQIPNQPTKQKSMMRLEAALAVDNTQNEIDFNLEAGSLRDIDDPLLGRGRASEDKPYKITRGARLRFGNFGIFEIDNQVDETRLSFSFGADPSDPTDLYQLRFGPKEATLSWGRDQFVSLTKDGLLIKAKAIGIAGPWVMWDPTKVAAFQQNQDLVQSDWAVTCRWDATQTTPGIRFDKSVYFGDKGEPAIIKGYLDTVVDLMLTTLDSHVHKVSGASTEGPIPPTKPIVQAFLTEPLVDTFLSIVKQPSTPST